MITRRFIVALGFLGLVALGGPAWATHQTFEWDLPTTNADGTPLTDLAASRVYTCASGPCSKATGVKVGEVPAPSAAPALGTKSTFPVPHGKQGLAFVTAVDTSGNESAESNVIPFDTLPPGVGSSLKVLQTP